MQKYKFNVKKLHQAHVHIKFKWQMFLQITAMRIIVLMQCEMLKNKIAITNIKYFSFTPISPK